MLTSHFVVIGDLQSPVSCHKECLLMIRLEDNIRDFLAEHLEMLEEGLRLVRKEFRLPNPGGAGGRIDIVAQDRLGHFVVIEIKRSDQAARQALNEVHKYTALFRLKQGLDSSSVRVMVVSTDWHELLLPLAEYAEVSPYSIQGIRIETDSVGIVLSASPLSLDSVIGGELIPLISSCQAAYLFDSKQARDAFTEAIAPSVDEAGIKDYFLLACDYRGGSNLVVYPYCLYFCFSSPLRDGGMSAAKALLEKGEWADDLDNPDENFLCAIRSPEECRQDDYEIGFPEKLTRIAIEWDIVMTRRFGVFAPDRSLHSDEELIKMAQAQTGGSDLYFNRVSSPQFASSWSFMREQVAPVFNGYPRWETIVQKAFDEIERSTPQATVSVSAYGPANLLISLYALSLEKTVAWLPQFCLVVYDANSKIVRVILGLLVWDGNPMNMQFDSVVKLLFGGLMEWSIANQFNATCEVESEALVAHNLREVVAEWIFSVDGERGPCELSDAKDALQRASPDQWKYRSIHDFASCHEVYLKSLEFTIDQFAASLRESISSAAKGKV
jgi:hypothetical protein